MTKKQGSFPLYFAFLGLFVLFMLSKSVFATASFYDSLPAAPKGKTLYLQISSDPKVINPLLSADSESSAVETFLWMPLLERDPLTLQFLPALATQYTVSQDKKRYSFTLNPKAKWQDGTPVTTKDIQFTFTTLMDSKTHSAALRSYYSGVSLDVTDEYHFAFKVSEPYFDTFQLLAGFTPIQKSQFVNVKDFNTSEEIMKPVGNSAYILEKYQRGQQIILKRNKNWWATTLSQYKNRYNPDEIVLRIIPNMNLAYEKFLQGDIDLFSFQPEQWKSKVLGTDKEKFGKDSTTSKKVWSLQIENLAPKPYSFIGWNLRNPLFQDKRTRIALSYLIDYQKIISKVYENLAIQATSPFGSFSPNSDAKLRTKQNMFSFQTSKAIALLKEAGWKNDGSPTLYKIENGKKIPFEFSLETNSNNTVRLKIAQIIKENFKKAGIQVNIKAVEWNSFLEKINQRAFDAVILGWTGTLFPNAKQLWDSHSIENEGSNFVSYKNPRVDSLIQQANVTFDEKKRHLIMQEINDIIYNDVPYTFLAESRFVLQGINSKIKSPRWVAPYENGVASDLVYLTAK